MNKLYPVVLFILCLIFSDITVYAGTDEELLDIYGKSTSVPIRQEILKELTSVSDDINNIKRIEEANRRYNEIVQSYNEEQADMFIKIQNTIDVYADDNQDIIDTFASDITTMNPKDMITLDTRYKANISKMNELAGSMNNVYIISDFKNTDFDLTSLYSQVAELTDQYEDAVDGYELGDIRPKYWLMSNDRYVISTFGYRVDPVNGTKLTYHAGTDYRAPVGTEVKALYNGTVIDTGYSKTAGNYITVQSGDKVKYFICHLDKVLVNKGDKIKQYDVIALSGSTGSRCTGPHLHVALYIYGAAYDVNELFE